MRLKAVSVKNYRCFEELAFSLDKNLTLIVGKNGAGKSTVLDAAAIVASTFLCGIDGGVSRSIQKEDARYQFYDFNGVVDPQHQFPVVLTGLGDCYGEEDIEWSRALNSENGKTTIKDAEGLIKIAQYMQGRVRGGDPDLILPILSYYGTGRLYAQKKEKKNLQNLQKFNRQIGYLDCMAAESNDKLMLNWFEKMTMKSLQNQQNGRIAPLPQLQAVERAVCKSFQCISNCENSSLVFDLDTHRMIMNYTLHGKKYRFALNEMSDGYKNTLSMIGDIAYRMAVLNPQLGEEVLEKTPGIIMIDEIDLHLHPEWQQAILGDLRNVFPEVQFIVTSHAPAVIHSVEREHIRILDQGRIYKPSEQTYGRDVNSIFREVMQVEERPQEIGELLGKFYCLIDEEKTEAAESCLRRIEEKIGDTDPEVNRAKVTLDFEKMKGELV